ncbi:MAG: 23S rRNA (adenine(1618)-N(6))-methyltransferase RlmF [Undibacterium umbellatum]|uniref:23S rRNA (adenine(1618)-N(6))-methyltransferase RlmF n=1 Tax=Undibacterium umbellatum TaxID=2762300 RepID=UPI003BB64E6B
MSNKNKKEKRNQAAGQLLHPRNRHHGRYDFPALIKAEPALQKFLTENPAGEATIDFAEPIVVKLLNKALLQSSYGVLEWDIPAENLCPPVPGRADYLHYLADLLAGSNQGRVPKGKQLLALDIGTGASCIYPLLGASEYGWSFCASDINDASLANAQTILDRNPGLGKQIQLRLQASAQTLFKGVIADDEWFDVSLCNPPFHGSAEEARAGSARKWENLNNSGKPGTTEPVLNFSGRDAELWCEGGELAFIDKMIRESATIPTKVLWFSTLVSKSANLPAIRAALKQVKVYDEKIIIMSQGNKESRLVAWTFLNASQQAAWAKLRWLNSKR